MKEKWRNRHTMGRAVEENIEKLINETAEYIIGLSDGTEISVEQASKTACGFDAWDVGNRELLRACSEIKRRVRKTGIELDFSKHEGEFTGLPYRREFVVRKPKFKSKKIDSNPGRRMKNR